MSYSSFLVGNRFGTILAELQPKIDFVSWRKNNIGNCRFIIAANDPKATKTILRFGNKIYVEFDNGLPAWGGVIDPTRTWKDGKITLNCYSAEYLFKYRSTDKGRYFVSQSVGEIFAELINEANAIEDTGVSVGEIWTGGGGHSPDYHFESILEIFKKSLTARLSTGDFVFVPIVADGQIKFIANFYESRGSDKTGFALIQDENLADITLKEQGPIINSWDVAGEGTGWGDERLTANATNIESVNLYGLREGSKIYSDVSVQGVLNDHASNLRDTNGDIYNIYTLEALDIKPAKFANYDIGDLVSLLAHDYGFEGTKTRIKILSREYSPQSGKCNLVVREEI